MRFFSTLVFGASALVTLASAQRLPFISWIPGTVEVGKTYNVTYKASAMDSPVTINLRKGESTALDNLGTLTTTAVGGSYMWTVSRSLANGDDYALEIIQGTAAPNYSDKFTISGSAVTTVVVVSATTTSASSSGSSSGSSSASASSTSSGSSKSGSPTKTGASAASSSGSATTGTGAASSSTGAASVLRGHLDVVFGAVAAAAYFL